MLARNFTVVWRPEQEQDFRVDHVSTLPPVNDQHTVLLFAAQEYEAECSGAMPATIHEPEVRRHVEVNPFDLVAIFEGHQTDIASF